MAQLICRQRCLETEERNVWPYSEPIGPKFRTIQICGFAFGCLWSRLSGLFSLIYITVPKAKCQMLVSLSSWAVQLLAML